MVWFTTSKMDNGLRHDSNFVVLINDSGSKFLNPSCGLRQGCPLALLVYFDGRKA